LKSVGIRELKRGISAYLREIRAGERILITDRKKRITIISSMEGGQETDRLERQEGRPSIIQLVKNER